MAKEGGLGDQLYLAGYDLSGDVGALSGVSGGHALQEVTGIDKSAVERITLLRDGKLSLTGWWDAADDAINEALKAMPTTDVLASYVMGITRGVPAACLIAKQIDLNADRGDDGSLAVSSALEGNAYGLDWCVSLNAGKETVVSAGNGTAVDLGNAQTAAVVLTSSSEANPSVILTAASHGLITGDSITIAGHTGSTPDINGNWEVTLVDADQFSIPIEVTTGGTGGTVQKTSTNFGAYAYLQVFSVPSNSITVHIEDSADGSTDWQDVAGLSFTAATAQTAGERKASTSATAIVRRYARTVTAGTFASAIIHCALIRHHTAPG